MSYFEELDLSVQINGKEVAGKLAPLLKSMTVTRQAGSSADTADITLADPDGQVVMPQERATCEISEGGVWLFSGFVTKPTWSISKSSGREMSISFSSIDHGGKVKEPVLRSKDDTSLSDVAKEWGEKAGLEVQVIGSIADIQREYWIMQHESFQSWAQRISKEVGGTVKIIGSRAIIAARNEGLSASGRPLTPVEAVVGEGGNVISASISPIVTRPKFKEIEVRYYDVAKGKHVTVPVPSEVQGVETKLRQLVNATNEDQAKKQGEALAKESDRESGTGTVVTTFISHAEPEAELTLSGARPGVDGAYRIDGVTHTATKKGGQTSHEIKLPKGGAGQDDR